MNVGKIVEFLLDVICRSNSKTTNDTPRERACYDEFESYIEEDYDSEEAKAKRFEKETIKMMYPLVLVRMMAMEE